MQKGECINTHFALSQQCKDGLTCKSQLTFTSTQYKASILKTGWVMTQEKTMQQNTLWKQTHTYKVI